MGKPRRKSELLFEGTDWDFDALWRTYDAIDEIARKDLGLDIYTNQIEIISSEQMLDAYSSVGMPVMYKHWSFGKNFLTHEHLYRKGATGLAYEIVINSNPCISYCMEENSMALQTLVTAHAAFGHNHFFKNNHLFKQWTDPDGILDYLDYAKSYIARCEERYGASEVEKTVDAAHALMQEGVFKHRRPVRPSLRREQERQRERLEMEEKATNYLWRTFEPDVERTQEESDERDRKRELDLPEENLLYFLERFSPVLKPWQREILRIVRHIAQYFYPQAQTKLMNEGCACFVHFYIVQELHRRRQLTDGTMLEILHNHTNVLTQPDYDDPRFSGINPYALGFAVMQDIRRICEQPTEEDRVWFPDIAGHKDWRNVIKDAWANFRDESFIQQFLSPTVMRHFRLFSISDDSEQPFYLVTGIHDERGFREVRDVLSRSYDVSVSKPDIQVVDVDLMGDRRLHVRSVHHNEVPLDPDARDATLRHLRHLWGYAVSLEEVSADGHSIARASAD